MTVTNQIIASLGKDMPRMDLFIAAHQPIDREKCVVAIAYHQDTNPPKANDIYAFTQRTFGNALVPQMATASVHPYDHAVSVVLTHNTVTRPAADASGMRAITAGTFAEDKTGNLWSLVTDGEGRRYLARNTDENVGDIVARVIRQNPRHPGLTVASLKTAAPMCTVGDSVKFFGSRNETLFGVIQKADGDRVVIKVPHTNEEHSVSRYSVAEIVSRGAGEKATDKATMTDFLATIYGSREFAEQITREDVNDAGLGSRVPSFSR